MARVALRPDTLEHFRRRLDAITPDLQRRWGTLEPVAMLAHLRRAVEISLGDHPAPDESTFLTRTLLKPLALTIMPWPKGKIKVPEVYAPAPEGDLDEERAKLLEQLERFLDRAAREPMRRVTHVAFGPMTMREWARAHGFHLSHHLAQFGV